MARKTRSDSKLDKLPPETRQELIDLFLHGNVSLRDAAAWLADLDKPVSISLSGLHTWHQRVVFPLRKEIRKQYATEAQAVASEALGRKVNYTKAIEVELAQQAYELLRSGVGRKDALEYAKTSLGAEEEKQKLEIARERLEQSEEKLEHEKEKFRESIKSKQEAGLDAVFEEIKGNAQAEALFAKMTAVIKRSWEK